MAPYSSYQKKQPAGITYDQIVREVHSGIIKPIYYLMGEESYYIDHVADYIVSSILKPEERDFNLTTLFGAEADIDGIMAAAQGFPMGAEKQVILVKEAQALKHIERLSNYLKHIQPTTVLVFCHKNGTLDKRLKELNTQINKVGILFDSKKLRDRELPKFVNNYFKRKQVAIEPGVAEMLSEYIGSNLNRMASEIDKLLLALPQGARMVTTDLVRANIGISKDFSIFELLDALAVKDKVKTYRIAKYFDSNPKEFPIQQILPNLFRFFSNLLMAYFAPNKTEAGIAAWLGQSEWQVKKNVLPPMRVYAPIKVMYIISEIRNTDARSKGVDNHNDFATNGELMKELLFYIMH